MSDGVFWNLGYKAAGDAPDDERPMQAVNSDGLAEGWIEGAQPQKKPDRLNPSLSGGGMGGSKVEMPATKPQVKSQSGQSRSLSASELKAWADSEIARMASPAQSPAVQPTIDRNMMEDERMEAESLPTRQPPPWLRAYMGDK